MARNPVSSNAVHAAAVGAVALAVAACGGSGPRPAVVAERPATTTMTTHSTASAPTTRAPAPKPPPPKPPPPKPPPPKPPPPPSYPQLISGAVGTASTPLVPAVRWNGQVVAWTERSPAGFAVMEFDQGLVELHLHSGTIDAGTLGWRYGPAVAPPELAHLVAAFNGGFRLSTGAGGFEAYGRIGAPLQTGVASIVTYTDGSTDIGSWGREVPAPGKHLASVRQNLTLLIDHGVAASTIDCVSCWGATLGGVIDPARSALGITANGRLVWVGGEGLTVSQLAEALLGAHVVRAAELDINPEWVAGYFYGRRGGKGPLAPVPALPSQNGIPGQFLAPWSRDFFTIVIR